MKMDGLYLAVMFELQDEFLLGFLSPYLSAIHFVGFR